MLYKQVLGYYHLVEKINVHDATMIKSVIWDSECGVIYMYVYIYIVYSQ